MFEQLQLYAQERLKITIARPKMFENPGCSFTPRRMHSTTPQPQGKSRRGQTKQYNFLFSSLNGNV
jgi:hypothetical protein